MFKQLRYGPRQYWRWSLCRVGRDVVCSMRLVGNWYYVKYLRTM